jgi:3-ketosteroid 9alpha-monooxygenase subunit B
MDRIFIGDNVNGDTIKPETLRVRLNGEIVELPADPDTNILESLLEEGYNPPYSCMEGNCMACMAKVSKGTVYQEDPGILTDENIEDCEILTCQAKPYSGNTIEVDYDY